MSTLYVQKKKKKPYTRFIILWETRVSYISALGISRNNKECLVHTEVLFRKYIPNSNMMLSSYHYKYVGQYMVSIQGN